MLPTAQDLVMLEFFSAVFFCSETFEHLLINELIECHDSTHVKYARESSTHSNSNQDSFQNCSSILKFYNMHCIAIGVLHSKLVYCSIQNALWNTFAFKRYTKILLFFNLCQEILFLSYIQRNSCPCAFICTGACYHVKYTLAFYY